MNLIDVSDLHVRYGAYEAVKGVSFALGKGEILGIVGESGSGKSTIAKTLMGLEKKSGGNVAMCLSSMQMIFQDAVGSLNPRMTVRQTLEEVLRCSRKTRAASGSSRSSGSSGSSGSRGSSDPCAASGSSAARTERSPRDLLELVGLSEAVLDQYPREMSGGQCQRVSIARALACEPEVLIADEPVSALDVSVQARVLNLLRDLRRELGLSILLIAHDLAVVKNVCDEICVMEHGKFVDRGESAAVFEHPQSEYTKKLLTAVPRIVV